MEKLETNRKQQIELKLNAFERVLSGGIRVGEAGRENGRFAMTLSAKWA
jgi:hypothetical protein